MAISVGVLLLGSGFLAYNRSRPSINADVAQQLASLSAEIDQLKRQQELPALVVNRYSPSICLIYGSYRVQLANQIVLRGRITGTGFVAEKGLVVTTRHVAEPWFRDPEAEDWMHRGATARLDRLLAFFPGMNSPLALEPLIVSNADLAVAAIRQPWGPDQLPPLPLASLPAKLGEPVMVIGYPMGIAGIVAKSPPAIYDRLASRSEDFRDINELAARSLVRPFATYGHLGDVVGAKLIYDAPTAHGGSGGPVFDSRGQVIGVNAAYIDGFAAGTLGVSIQFLQPLLEAAKHAKANPTDKVTVGEHRKGHMSPR